MPGPFDAAADALAHSLTGWATETCTYRQGVNVLSVRCAFLPGVHDVEDADGLPHTLKTDDVLIAAGELPAMPAAGDRILRTARGRRQQTLTYELTDHTGLPAWQWHGDNHYLLHTRQIDEDEA